MDDSLHAARLGDLILHPPLMAELVSTLTEAVVYAAATAAVAAAIGGAVVAVVGTGGAATVLTPLIAGALVGAAAMLPGGEDKSIGEQISGFSDWVGNSMFPPEPYGAIQTGSDNTHINGIPAARAAGISTGPVTAEAPEEEPSILENVGAYAMLGASMMLPIIGLAQEINGIFNPPISQAADPGTQPANHDKAQCSKHPPMPEQFVAQGSDKVFINGQPAARVGDKTTCDGPIGMTFSPNVRIGGGTLTVRDIRDGKSALAKAIGLVAGMLIARRGRVRARPGKAPKPGSKIPRCKGRPVVVSTGSKLLDGPEDHDFTVPGLLPIEWTRRYDSNDMRTEGLLGKGWSLPYEAEVQRVEHPQGGDLWIYVDEEGTRLELGRLQVGSAFVSSMDGLAFFQQDSGITVVEDIYSGRYQVFSVDPLNKRRSRLVQLGDRNLNRLDLLHDVSGRLQYLVDTFGRTVVELCYDAVHPRRVAQVRRVYLRPGNEFDVLSHEPLVTYGYTASGQLSEVTDREGRCVRRFSYTAEGYMASQTLPAGGVFHYQWQRYPVLSRPAHGESLSNTSMPTLLETQPDHEWRVVRHWGGTGEEYHFEYDIATGHTQVTDSLGRIEHFLWGAQYELYAYTDPNGDCWRETIENGQLVETQDPLGNTWRYSYDSIGRMVASEDPLGRTHTYLYTEHWSLPTSVTDGAGRTRRYQYDRKGNLTCETDPLGRQTRYQHDAHGRVIRITDPLGKIRHLQWNDHGQLLAYRDCSGMQTTYRYDARGNLKQTTDAQGAVTHFDHDGCANPISIQHPDGRVERYVFDSSGQLSRHIDPAGQATQWQYDSCGRLVSRTDAMGLTVRYTYDAYGRMRQLSNENNEHYHFEWDALDRLVAQQNLDGSGTSYRYAANGELTQLRHPRQINGEQAAQIQHYCRDAAGRLASKRTADGLTEYLYDHADNLLSVQFTSLKGEVQQVAFSYDPLDRIISETAQLGTLQLERDELGNLQTVILDDLRRINYLYYGSGHLHQINLDGRVISDFERNDLHAEVLRSQGQLATRTRHDFANRIVQKAIYNADASSASLALLQKDYQYDAGGNLAAETLTPFQPCPPTSSDRLSQLPGMAGFTLPSQTTRRYDHGPTERLHAVTSTTADNPSPRVEIHAYDKAGNLLDGYQVNRTVRHDQLLSHDGKHYRYDGFGRLVEKRCASMLTQRFEYDAEDRLTRVHQQRGPISERIEFTYDPLGRRASKTLYREGVTQALSHTQFQWQGLRLLQEITDSRASVYVYTDAYGHEPLARIDGCAGEERLRYFHTNVAGLPEQLSTEDGEIVWQCQYSAWGAPLDERHSADETQPQNLRYQGQYLDRETGLHYNTFRYFDPDIGRFTQPDPIGLAGGTNLYRYAPNALLWIDPFGWMPFWKPLKHDGMGHHPFPRGHADDHGFSELSSKWDSPSWYPNEVDGSDKVHENFHKAIAKEGVPFSSKFKGTTADLLSKIDKAYKPFTEKGFLKIPRTGQILAKDVTIGEAFRKIIGSSKTPGCDL